MKAIGFTKMHGAGNDYIYVDTARYPLNRPEELAVRWSAPHTGIGSDGLVLVGRSDKADFSMRIFNADGSEAMMCGNASRCIGKYVYENGLTDKTELTLETLSGIRRLRLHVADGLVESVTVDMGQPLLRNVRQVATADGSLRAARVETEAGSYTGTFVCMGNPHLVIFTDDLSRVDLPAEGPLLEHHPLFPERVNVEFVQPLPDGTLRMRVWERGSGVTQACGTGACATAVAAALGGKSGRESVVRMDGGQLTIRWDEADGHVYMTGPATTVFTGEIAL
jgi:diaminopimelate epimerase